MKLVFSSDAWDDYQYWLKEDLKLFVRLNALIEETRRNPFKGTGKPEPLKHEFKGYWSRRINQEHRLVYRVEGSAAEQRLEIIQCRFHT